MFLRRTTQLILILYALLTAYTLVSMHFGVPFQPFFTPLLTLLAFIFALLHGSQFLGWKRTLLLLVLTFGISLLFECVGVATGWIYGPYHYTAKLGPKFLGLVPLLIPVAWFMMTYPSFVLARYLVPAMKNKWVWWLLVSASGALIMTSWDLAMDPMMVAAGHWVWEQQGSYFGIPLQNYFGWWLTTFVTFFLFLSLARIAPEPAPSTDQFSRLPLISYLVATFSSVVTDFEFGLSGPALAGLFALLPWLIMGWLKTQFTTTQEPA